MCVWPCQMNEAVHIFWRTEPATERILRSFLSYKKIKIVNLFFFDILLTL